MMTPISSGMPNNRLSPIAVPITSARSVAQIAISASTHSGHDTARGKASRQACAKSRPAPIPSRAQSACKRIAIRFESSAMVSSEYPNFDPPASEVAQLPGSM